MKQERKQRKKEKKLKRFEKIESLKKKWKEEKTSKNEPIPQKPRKEEILGAGGPPPPPPPQPSSKYNDDFQQEGSQVAQKAIKLLAYKHELKSFNFEEDSQAEIWLFLGISAVAATAKVLVECGVENFRLMFFEKPKFETMLWMY